MSLINKLVRGLFFSHVYLSLAAICFYYAGYRLIGGAQPKTEYLLMLFFSTFITYNIYRFLAAPVGDSSTLPEKEYWHQQNRRTVSVLLLISIIGLGVIFLDYLDFRSVLFLSHLALISIFYNLPDTYLPTWLRIRRIPLLKVVLVGYVWGALSVFLPAIRQGYSMLDSTIIELFLAHLLFIIAITIPFDFRDLEKDRQNGLITLPLLIGIRASKAIAIILLLVFTVIIWKYNGHFVFIIVSLFTGALIALANERRHELYFSLGLDGTIFLYSLSAIWVTLR